jgi:hypothetical protein
VLHDGTFEIAEIGQRAVFRHAVDATAKKPMVNRLF